MQRINPIAGDAPRRYHSTMSGTDESLILEDGRPPIRRLLVALVSGSVILGAVILLFVFLMESLNRTAADGAVAATLARALPIFAYILAFNLTLGAVAAVVLRVLDLRGPVAWTLAGAVGGGAAAALYAGVEGVELGRGLLITCAMLGWGEFLVVRWIAGLR